MSNEARYSGSDCDGGRRESDVRSKGEVGGSEVMKEVRVCNSLESNGSSEYIKDDLIRRERVVSLKYCDLSMMRFGVFSIGSDYGAVKWVV
mmetsp:Transcript_11425/g.20667  ORF Transcript_11425/g.20667 Transcript_11425/m.20667 type:complete len:91 (-) Transcript_11425:229-501(-)